MTPPAKRGFLPGVKWQVLALAPGLAWNLGVLAPARVATFYLDFNQPPGSLLTRLDSTTPGLIGALPAGFRVGTGPFADIPGAVSPWPVEPAAPMQFFRAVERQ